MAYVTTEEMLRNARKEGYAVGAFNAENMEMVQAIIDAAETVSAPVIIQTTPSTLRYGLPELFAGMVRPLAERASVPVALHLDHGDSTELCRNALNAGYSSVMIDGSRHAWEENLRVTRTVVEWGRAMGIPTEAELGKVGGKEDDLESDGGYTDPAEAAEFIAKTGVSSLAVAIGTAHGVYHGVPKLDVPRLRRIHEATEIPLVLHGASGLSDEAIRDCVAEGICKVNFATELRIAYTHAVRETLSAQPDAFDPKIFGKAACAAVKAQVQERIRVCGAEGKAR